VNSEAPLFFRASASCSKLLNDKNYIQYSEQFLGNSVFQGKRRCSKILDSKKYIQYGEKFQGNSVFRSSASCYQRWSNSGFLLSDPILFLKNGIRIRSDPNPVLVEIILSVSENYPKVYCDAQHTFLRCAYFASWGKITAGAILPLAKHWLKQSHDKFGTHVLVSWPWHL